MTDLARLKVEADAAGAEATRLRSLVTKAEYVAEQARMEPLKELAILAHDALCSWNHTDGCGWMYEMTNGQHAWGSYAHQAWLKKVDALVNGGNRPSSRAMSKKSPETLREILTVFAKLKETHRDALWMLRHGLSV